MKPSISARPPAFTPGPVLLEVRLDDELLFTLHEAPDAPPIAQCRLRVTDGPDNFLTFNMTQAAEVDDKFVCYLIMRVIRRGSKE